MRIVFFIDFTFQDNIPEICVTLQTFSVSFIGVWFYMSICSIAYRQISGRLTNSIPSPTADRFVLIKYADRGLVNDRYYYNMNMTLFKNLFWLSNISSKYFHNKDGKPLVANKCVFESIQISVDNLFESPLHC